MRPLGRFPKPGRVGGRPGARYRLKRGNFLLSAPTLESTTTGVKRGFWEFLRGFSRILEAKPKAQGDSS